MNTLTQEQQKAIDLNGDLLVVASAGTGKTTTLVSRCEKFIFDETNPIPLDRILMVTFTEAAAAEMRVRIRRKLEDALIHAGSNPTMSRQYALLPTAHISTLHSFCLRLIKLYFHDLGLDPQIEVLDEGQARLLALKVLEDIFNRHYAGETDFDNRVRDLIAVRCRGYDVIIKEKVLQLHYFASSLPFSELWLKKQLEIYSNAKPHFWISLLNIEIKSWADNWIKRAELWREAENVAECHDELKEILSSEGFLNALPHLKACLEAMNKNWQRGMATRIRDRYFKEFIKDLEFLCSFAPDSDNDSPLLSLEKDWEIVRRHIATLIELALEFSAEFSKAKREANAVDFNDLEQMTLNLLFDSEGNRTPIAEELRRRFDLIFVDEYQDINPVQHLIISAISRDEGNRFLVGDVKQSIYQFRHANPYIFLKLADQWNNAGNSKNVVNLTFNFRSRPEILRFINEVFRVLMREDVADIRYDEEVFLKPGNALLEDDKNGGNEIPRVELHLLLNEDTGNNGDEESDNITLDEEPTIVQKEAAMIGEKIRKLKNSGFEIFDKKLSAKRKIEWRDIAILMRSPANRAEIYAREFALQGIPVVAPCGDALSAIECQDLINLLRLLDNPYQDLPLSAVLYSPLVGFTLLELSLLRQVYPKGRLWNAVKKFPEQKSDLTNRVLSSNILDETQRQRLLAAIESAASKAEDFHQMYNRWRKICRQISLSQTLEVILDDTQYIAWCQGQADGARKYANVQVLLELTRQFDPLQRQGLSRFLRYIESRAEAEIETEPISSEGENAVRLMSIHQAKGLEFPIVFVADLGKKFNLMDVNSDIILDEELGICPKVYSELPGQSYPSPAHWIARKKKLRKMISEEIRLLYVALTRACDLLIMTGTTNLKKVKNLYYKLDDWQLSAEAIMKSQNMLEWLILWLWHYYKNDKWCEKEFGKAGDLFWMIRRVNYLSLVSLIEDSSGTSQTMPEEQYEPVELAKLDERLTWSYPNTAYTLQPAKTSVSDIRRQYLRDLEEESSSFFKFIKPSILTKPLETSEDLSAVERGELYHKLLELIDLSKTGSIQALRDDMDRLIQLGKLPSNVFEFVDLEKILSFWNSEIGKLLLSNVSRLRRELPFTVKLSEKDFSNLPVLTALQSLKDDFIVLQGVVDLAMVSDSEIWILDYKTDQINSDQMNERVREYSLQLKLYGFALNKIYKLPVTHKWIHFISLNKTIECL